MFKSKEEKLEKRIERLSNEIERLNKKNLELIQELDKFYAKEMIMEKNSELIDATKIELDRLVAENRNIQEEYSKLLSEERVDNAKRKKEFDELMKELR